MKEHRMKTLEAGCTDYLSKPVNRDKLSEMLQKYIKVPAKPAKAVKKEKAKPESSEEDAIMVELTQFFIEDLGIRLKKFLSDVETKAKDEVIRFGHSLKGTGGSYGFPQFSKIGAAIEDAGRDGKWDAISTLKDELVKDGGK
jgi:HPt (histidine-containing phosphotransfer) domain-containing protein